MRAALARKKKLLAHICCTWRPGDQTRHKLRKHVSFPRLNTPDDRTIRPSDHTTVASLDHSTFANRQHADAMVGLYDHRITRQQRIRESAARTCHGWITRPSHHSPIYTQRRAAPRDHYSFARDSRAKLCPTTHPMIFLRSGRSSTRARPAPTGAELATVLVYLPARPNITPRLSLLFWPSAANLRWLAQR